MYINTDEIYGGTWEHKCIVQIKMYIEYMKYVCVCCEAEWWKTPSYINYLYVSHMQFFPKYASPYYVPCVDQLLLF